MSLAVFIAKPLTYFKTVRHCEVLRVLDSGEIRRSHSGVSEGYILLFQPTPFILYFPTVCCHLNSVVDLRVQYKLVVSLIYWSKFPPPMRQILGGTSARMPGEQYAFH